MSTPELEMIASVYATLNADPDIASAFGESVFMDWIAEDTDYPAMTIGHGTIVDDRGTDLDMIDTELFVDVWARRDDLSLNGTPANVFVRTKARAVRDILDDASRAKRGAPRIPLTGFVLARLIHTTTLSLPEPLNGVERTRVTFGASIEKERT